MKNEWHGNMVAEGDQLVQIEILFAIDVDVHVPDADGQQVYSCFPYELPCEPGIFEYALSFNSAGCTARQFPQFCLNGHFAGMRMSRDVLYPKEVFIVRRLRIGGH